MASDPRSPGDPASPAATSSRDDAPGAPSCAGVVPGALDGIRVLDLSRVLAGPWCTQILGDLGADVVKVERPGRGDDTRGWGPPFLHDADGRETAEAAYFLGTNRNKRSIAIDLAHPDGQALVRRLAREADVLVENHKVGDMARHGLGAERLRAENPQLVHCSITGFGQTGPYRDRPGYDYAVQGLGGLMSVTGPSRDDIADDRPGGGPQKVGVAVADLFTGLYATVAILAALRHRDAHGFRRGEGQCIDMALLDVQVAMLANLGAGYLVSGEVPGRSGNAHANIVPYQTFEVADGHLILAVGNDAQFRRLCAVIGCPELADDPRFATNAERVRHRAVLVPQLAQRLRTRPRDAWLRELEAAKVPCGPIQSLDQVFADPQVVARGMTQTLPHPLAEGLRLVASPLRLSATPVSARRPPPLLAQHRDEVLADWLGLPAGEVEALAAAGAFGARDGGCSDASDGDPGR